MHHFKKKELQPHKSDYWLEPKIDDWFLFQLRVQLICRLYVRSWYYRQQGIRILSVDEKPGIQALSRKQTRALAPGKRAHFDPEYKRNGTVTLIATKDVADGQVIHQSLTNSHKEEVFLTHFQESVAKIPEDQWVIVIMDQLVTHKSASLVEWVAGQNGFQGDLGVKGRRGILKNKKSRTEFLESPHHRIRVVFTPKHCSWLNQIENWFSILSRRMLKNAYFDSVKELIEKIERFISFYNQFDAKAMNWKYKKEAECIFANSPSP